jgi:peptidoglycan/LPS O-acetylase OafA/YrhL
MSVLKERNWGLDLMRSIAILMVLIHHWVAYNLSNFHLTKSFVHYFSLLGYYGVEIFFVLSGFLIGNILIKVYLNTAFNFAQILNFWMRRWFRTLPLYYFILILHILIVVVKGSDLSFIWRYFLFLQNFLAYNTTNNDFFGESWSLALEEWFYLSFPLFIVFFDLLLKKAYSKQKIVLFTIIAYIAIPTIVRIVLAYGQDPSWNNVLRKAIICREDSIAYGVLGAYLYQFKASFFHKPKLWLNLLGLMMLVAGAAIFIVEIANDYYYKVGDVSFFSKTFLFSLVSIGTLLLLPFFYHVKCRYKIFSLPITFISKISYSLYLVHLFVEHAAQKILRGNDLQMILLRLLFFIVISTLLSSITYKFIEEKFLLVRDRFWREKSKAV